MSRSAVRFSVLVAVGFLMGACGVVDSGEITAGSNASWSTPLAEEGISIWIDNATRGDVEVVAVSLATDETNSGAYSIVEAGYELVDSNSSPAGPLQPFPIEVGSAETVEVFVRYTFASCDDIGEWNIDEETGLVTFGSWIGLPFQIEFADGQMIQADATTDVLSDFYEPSVCE